MKHYSRVILFLVDGARADTVEDYLAAGKLPSTQKYIVAPGTHTRATTVFPSASGIAYLPFLSGMFPGPANIPGIRWFDRRAYHERGFFSLNRFRSYIGPGSYLLNKDLRSPKTLFEIFDKSANIFSMLNRGSGFWGNKTKFLRALAYIRARYSGDWLWVDRLGQRLLKRALRRNHDFIFHLSISVDEYAHHEGLESANLQRAYTFFDEVVRETGEFLERSGKLDETLMIVSSDHGHSATHTHFELVHFLETHGFRPLYYYSKPFRKDPDSAVMVSGNSMAHINIKGEHGWIQGVTIEELRRTHRGFIDALSRELAVDFIAMRDGEERVHVVSERGEARISFPGGRVRYEVLRGDPFGYPAMPYEQSPSESLVRTFDTNYPDGPIQLLQLFQSPRTGDIVVSAADGYDLRDKEEKPSQASSHGSMHREHMHVPLLLNHKISTDRPLRTVDVFPSILELTGKIVPPDLHGTSFVGKDEG